MIALICIFKMNKSKEAAGYLVILYPPMTPQRVPFNLGENIIGRLESRSNVVVNHASISQKHARLFVTPQTMTITDVGSKNGVKINNEDNELERHKEVTIDESMNIYLAEVKCKFVRQKGLEVLKIKSAIEPIVQKEKKTTYLGNLFLQQDEAKKQSNGPKTKKQDGNIANKNNDLNIEEGFQKQRKKQVKQKAVPISKKQIETTHIGKQTGKQVREEKEKKIKNQKKTISDDQNNSNLDNKKQTKNTGNSLQSKRQKEQFKEGKKEEARREEKREENIAAKVAIKQQKDIKKEKAEVEADNKKESSIDKQDNNVKKEKKSKKEPQIKNISDYEQEQSKPEKQGKANRMKQIKDKSKLVVVQQDQSEDKSNLTNIQPRLPFSTKRRVQNRKRLPTQSILKQAGIIAQRRSFINRRILVSGFTLQLSKKYFQIVESIEDEFDFLVMKEYKRTFKALFCICKGIPIVKYDWLRESEMFERTLKYDNYYFKEHPQIYQSIEAVKTGNKVLNGNVFCLASDQFHLKIDDIQILIVAAGGEVMKKVGKLTDKEKKNPVIIALIQNLDDKNKEGFETDLNKAKKLGFDKIYTVEMILDSIETQQINWQKNRAKVE